MRALRVTVAVAAAAGLSACAPVPPYGGAGVDINRGAYAQDYTAYEAERAAREAALQGGAIPVPDRPVISGAELSAAGLPVAGVNPLPGPLGGPVNSAAAPFGAGVPLEGSAPFGTTDPLLAPPSPIASTPLAGASTGTGISDEQDFDAVSSRETIESDRARLAAQAQAYQVIQPTALPTRPNTGPNIVAYALSTTNAVGESRYQRSGFNAANRSARACGRYASPDLAQEDFLANGGPERDRKTLDPDGDGYACAWDPAPFRTVRN